MTREQIIETLKKLQYRIDVGSKEDPERENAIRLRDRLCSKYGIRVEDLATNKVEVREFDAQTREEAQVIIQYAFTKLMRKQDEFSLYSHKRSRYGKKLYSVEIPMSEDEYLSHGKIIVELVRLHRRRKEEYRHKLLEVMKKQLAAWDYQFLQSANLLAKAEPGTAAAKPKWGLDEAMKAARDLDGTIFPESYLAQQQKALSHTG